MSCQCCSNSKEILDIKQLYLESIDERLSNEERICRNNILEKIKNQQEITVDEDIKKLVGKNVLKVENNQLVSIYPISLVTSDKKVFMNNHFYYAMCALDAIGFYWTFHQKVKVESIIKDTNQPLILEVDEKGIHSNQEVYVLYPDLRLCDDWSSHCCKHMHFFSSKNAITQYQKQQGLENATIVALSLEEAFLVSQWLFKRVK